MKKYKKSSVIKNIKKEQRYNLHSCVDSLIPKTSFHFFEFTGLTF